MSNLVVCEISVVAQTLAHLREGGARGVETVVLWIGSSGKGCDRVDEVYRPAQEAAEDYFRIPPESMRELMKHLRFRRGKIVAQVHSHPHHAFHSPADDAWAIVRHVGALSLVIPTFGLDTEVANFERRTAVYQLDHHDRWRAVPFASVLQVEQ